MEQDSDRNGWGAATVREIPDALIDKRGNLLREVGRAAALADPVPPQVIEDAREALGFKKTVSSLDPTNQIENGELFIQMDQQ